jgi:hypothetical protein
VATAKGSTNSILVHLDGNHWSLYSTVCPGADPGILKGGGPGSSGIFFKRGGGLTTAICIGSSGPGPNTNNWV